MTALQLPAHLANRQPQGMADRAAEGMGSSLPPHVSISGNSFTFVDASGNEAQPVLTFDGLIVDISDHLNKRYYDKAYDPSAAGEPPACWSANGIAPSREASRPQAERCDICQHNVRGSAISKMSGAAIKACRDERWIAVMVPAFGNMIFQFVVTPGSFTSWKAYVTMLQNYKVEPNWVVTRFSFQPKVNGVVLFEFTGTYANAATVDLTDLARLEKKTDVIVGRNDQPRMAAIAAPARPVGLLAAAPQEEQSAPAPIGAVQTPFGMSGIAGYAATPTTPASTPASASPFPPTSTEPTQRRRRRTNAEMAATAPQGQPAPTAAPVAPFMPQQASTAGGTLQGAGAAAGTQNTFGIQSGAPVNPEMSKMLSSLFPNKAG